MGKRLAAKQKASVSKDNGAVGAAPEQPPALVRETSATSPLCRHEGLAKPSFSEGPSAAPIDEAAWNADIDAVLEDIDPRLKKKLDKAGLRSTYLTFAALEEGDGKDAIFGEGILRLFDSLKIDPSSDLVSLAFAQQCKAKEMGIFRRQEFLRGLAVLGVDSLDGLRRKIPELRLQLTVLKQRQEIYAYAFELALEPNSKVLDMGDACRLWDLFFPECPHLEDWGGWVIETKQRPCSRDLWDMFWLFATEVPADLSTYDDSSDWPVQLDEFVEYLRAKKGKGG